MVKFKKLISIMLCGIIILLGNISSIEVNATQSGGYIAISTKEELNNIRNNLSGKYYLTNDIIFTDEDFKEGGAFYNNGSGFEPIGDKGNQFTGTFDGNGYTIAGLKINKSVKSESAVGLFGYNSGSINNVIMTGADIHVDALNGDVEYGIYVGAVAGYNFGTVTGCYVSSLVSGTTSDMLVYAGGITGYNLGGSISEAYNSGHIDVDLTIYGVNVSSNEILTSYGGVVGYNEGSINKASFMGVVSVNTPYANRSNTTTSLYRFSFSGGISGGNEGSITNCYNIGEVDVTAFAIYAAGITGYNAGSITYTYNEGDVIYKCGIDNFTKVGAIAGYSEDKVGSIATSYYLNNLTQGVGTENGTTNVLDRAQMADRAQYVGFNFSGIWTIEDGVSAPTLKNVSENTVTTPSIYYTTHVQTYADMLYAIDGGTSGMAGAGKRIESLEVEIKGIEGLDVEYSTHVQSYGWMSPVSGGEVSGTEGEAKRIEAVKMNLIGKNASLYDIYYRVYTETYGWLGWACNGEEAGTSGLSKRIEAIEIVLIESGEDAPGSTTRPYVTTPPDVLYSTHIQTYGWQTSVANGAISGTTGESKRLEGITIQLQNIKNVSGGITYRTHVQTYGWQSYVSDGAVSGTTGEAKRLEAIEIKLTGELEEIYDVYYRVHSQTYGWLDWACNGGKAGSSGLAKRLEAIQIVIVEKGASAPGSTDRPYVTN